MNATLSSAAESMRGTLHGADCPFDGVSTDSRTLKCGDLFFALSGPNFDGGEFVSQVSEKGAAGAVVKSVVEDDVAQITVDDTRLALGRLGATWRQSHAATVVGVTGSNGKTTIKEMIAACLSQIAPTLATAGNLNNDIGMPLMLLRIDSSHRYAVLEMGANHAGEIGYLTSLARPDVVVISNAGVAHLEGYGSITGIAHGKGEILQSDTRPQFAILNAEDEFYQYWLSLVDDIEILSFGLGEGADVHADHIVAEKGSTSFRLHLPAAVVDLTLPLAGIHNVRNACAAAAVTTALGVSPEQIRNAFESIEPMAGRLQPVAGRNGAVVYDDSYNANPDSVCAAGDFLATLSGRNWLVLGDMFELGENADQLHFDTGKALADGRVERLFAIGDLSKHTIKGFGDGGEWFASIDDLIASVMADISADVNILIKGSRGMRMERVVEALRATDAMRREA
ncbi:MAG: UDP-N-acetylmuramoyl-tripeptide--D-alanyl-D-alanine ligase [Proteobacteria bacterium]|nr:UDP-N-acetylmuramoyl-tripeptide--D-alanyl-D-alanine ligase [Pseudomonadota bacterium]